MRHLQVKQLWLQENVAAGELTIVNIPRVENCADALTHPWGVSDLPFWEIMGVCFIPRQPVHPESHCGQSLRVIVLLGSIERSQALAMVTRASTASFNRVVSANPKTPFSKVSDGERGGVLCTHITAPS